MEVVWAVLGGSFGAALVTGTLELWKWWVERRDRRSGKTDCVNKALRYLMLYLIQERAKQHLREGRISLEDRRALHHWHGLYHDGLGGNGDADALMEAVDRLPVDTEH